MLISVAVILAGVGFVGGFLAGVRSPAHASLAGQAASAFGANVQPTGVDFSPVWRAWSVIDDKFVPASVPTSTPTTTNPTDQRLWGMIQGLAGSLGDPYTYFLPPAEQQQFEDDMSGSFEGVGMEIAVRDQVLTVVSPLKGTPADRAGLQAGDRILQIDGKSTDGIDISDAVRHIRGPKGSEVVLTILREGWTESREFRVVRDVINVPIVTTEEKAGGVFVISVSTFTSNAPALFRDALRTFVESGDSKLVLDLRGNPGGYLEAAVDMASWFTPSGRTIVTEDYAGNADNIVHRSRGYDIFSDDLHMVILVDKGSASASEILAAALRYWRETPLIGTNTFGKGSVQELVEITPETALKLTVARWLQPDGTQIPNSGLVPDVEIAVTEEDIAAGKDPQMAKALEILNSM